MPAQFPAHACLHLPVCTCCKECPYPAPRMCWSVLSKNGLTCPLLPSDSPSFLCWQNSGSSLIFCPWLLVLPSCPSFFTSTSLISACMCQMQALVSLCSCCSTHAKGPSIDSFPILLTHSLPCPVHCPSPMPHIAGNHPSSFKTTHTKGKWLCVICITCTNWPHAIIGQCNWSRRVLCLSCCTAYIPHLFPFCSPSTQLPCHCFILYIYNSFPPTSSIQTL